jgi:hypothetical protein
MGTKNVVVKVTPKNGTCSGTQLSKTVVYKASGCAKEGLTEEEDLSAEKEITVFPNPVQDLLFVEGFAGAEYKLYDLSGKWVAAGRIMSEQESLEFSAYAAGVYQLHLQQANANHVYKIIKTHH